jgi:hypothetical protein
LYSAHAQSGQNDRQNIAQQLRPALAIVQSLELLGQRLCFRGVLLDRDLLNGCRFARTSATGVSCSA